VVNSRRSDRWERWGLAVLLAASPGLACHRKTSPPALATAAAHPNARVRLNGAPPEVDAGVAGQGADDASPEIPRQVCPAGTDRMEAYAKAYEARNYQVALVCAEDELLDDGESAAAEQGRAAALAALGRGDDARLAFAHALALDPDDPETLLGAADLYLSRGNGSREYDEIGLEYARRGERRARRRHPELLEQLLLLQGMALNDLGRATEALPKLDEAVQREPTDLDARYERGVALFELCRFAEAKADLTAVLASLPEDAYAHHQLGLTLERLGDAKGAVRELKRATELDAQAFPEPIGVDAADFARMVQRAVDALPADLKKDLRLARISIQDAPDLGDLTVDDPPLSPTILGLFRGEPLAGVDAGKPTAGRSPGEEPRAIVLYRRNLIRVARSQEELEKQVRITLWHELGHLRGADDDELRLRGLE
jgi:predicted Zn-dependent protease with MMP-like domain/Flp pilus assembly protein TadD